MADNNRARFHQPAQAEVNYLSLLLTLILLITTIVVFNLVYYIRSNHWCWEWNGCLNIRNCKCSLSNWTYMSNFQPLEVVGRGSESQLQEAENLNSYFSRIRVNTWSNLNQSVSLILTYFQVDIAYWAHQKPDVEPVLVQCWPSVADNIDLMMGENFVLGPH